MTAIQPEYMRVRDLAKYSSISEVVWNRRRVDGDGPPFIKSGRVVLYKRSDVDQWLAARKVSSTSQRPEVGGDDAR